MTEVVDLSAIETVGEELYHALIRRAVIQPPRVRCDGLKLPDAYRISAAFLSRRLARGERLVGLKLGMTSFAAHAAFGIHEPIYGYLTDAMRYEAEASVSLAGGFMQPRIEGEIAFLLGTALDGPDVSAEDVLHGTKAVFPALEIVDSRVRDWDVRLEDAVADNACGGGFVLGPPRDPRDFDFAGCSVELKKDGETLAAGTGAEAMGSSLKCVAWLANALAVKGCSLQAGQIVLAGALAPAVPVTSSGRFQVDIERLGSVAISFE